MTQQIPLGLSLNDAARFSNYYAIDNDALFHALTDVSEQYVYIWGPGGVGKSHLMHACCYEFLQNNKTVFYLSLADESITSPDILQGVTQYDLVCLDDIDAVVKKPDWEAALFGLYNQIRDSGHCLRVAGKQSPTSLPLDLPDLISRLCWGPVFQLRELDDEQKLKAIQLRSHNRGIKVDDKVGKYLLQHSSRDMHSLFELLDRLDAASISQQRKLTIPFVKQYL